MDGGRIGLGHRQAQVLLARQRQQQGLERGLSRLVPDRPAHGGGEARLARLVRRTRGAAEDQLAGAALAGLPAVEQVRIARQQHIVVLRRRADLQGHRGGELAQGRDHRPPLDAGQAQAPLGPVQHDHRVLDRRLAVRRAEAQALAVAVEQADPHRDRQGLLVGLAGRGRGGLAELDVERLGFGVVVGGEADDRRAGLAVPAEELRQVAPGGVGEAGDESLHGGGLAVMALEIEVHAGAEGLRAKQGLQHTDDFGALVVDRGRVEVVDLHEAGRADRVGEGAGVLGELAAAQGPHVLDPLHRRPAHVGREALVAEHRQALLQAQLEPVAAGDAVAGPVVEVLVRHHALDALEVEVGRRGRVGQQQRGVEDVQPLVLHRPEIEVAHGHDHEQVEVVFAAEGLLVPLHRALQRIHGVGGAGSHPRVDIDAQVDLPPRHGGEVVGQFVELPGDQGEQVAGLGEGIAPQGPVPAIGGVPAVDAVAVGQEARIGGLVGVHPHGEARQHVGPVGEVGDLAEALGLALGAEAAAGHV